MVPRMVVLILMVKLLVMMMAVMILLDSLRGDKAGCKVDHSEGREEVEQKGEVGVRFQYKLISYTPYKLINKLQTYRTDLN